MEIDVKVLCGVLLAAAVLAAASPAWSARAANRQTPRQAELNLLQSPRILGKWSASFVDPATKLLRSNIVVRCAGVGRQVAGSFHTLRCTVTRAPWRVRLRYVALGRYGFIAQRVRTTRT
jgi:hypothetical protein